MASLCRCGAARCRPSGAIFRGCASTSSPGKSRKRKLGNSKKIIGPPHPVSNISPIVLVETENETALEKRLRVHHLAMNERNHQFWLAHNLQFEKEKEEFTTQRLKSSDAAVSDSGSLSPDEFAAFYRDFLVGKKASLRAYNRAWLADISLYIWLSFQVKLERLMFWRGR